MKFSIPLDSCLDGVTAAAKAAYEGMRPDLTNVISNRAILESENANGELLNRCTEDYITLMKASWEENSLMRPSFDRIVEMLQLITSKVSNNKEIDK